MEKLNKIAKQIVAWGILIGIGLGVGKIIIDNLVTILIAMMIFCFRKEIKQWLYRVKNGNPEGVLYDLWVLTIGKLPPIIHLLNLKKKDEIEESNTTNKKIILSKSTFDNIRKLNIFQPSGKILWKGKVIRIGEKFFLEEIGVAEGQDEREMIFDEIVVKDCLPDCYRVSLENISYKGELQRMAVLTKQNFFISCLNVRVPDEEDEDEENEVIMFMIYTQENGLEENVPWEVE